MTGPRRCLVLLLSLASGCGLLRPKRPDPEVAELLEAPHGAAVAAARRWLETGDVARASALLDELFRRSPTDTETRVLWARAAARRAAAAGDPVAYDDAVRELERAEAAVPDDPEPAYWLGRLEFDRRHFTHARRAFEEALRRRPGHLESLRMLAWCERATGRPKAERAAWERLLASRPSDPVASFELGLLLAATKDEDERARGAALVARAEEADDAPRWLLLEAGRRRSAAGELERAAVVLERAVRHRETAAAGAVAAEDEEVWFALGAAAQALGDAERARTAYARALAADPDDPRVWANLGLLDAEAGHADLARERLERAADLAGGNRALREAIWERLEEVEKADSERGGEDDEGARSSAVRAADS